MSYTQTFATLSFVGVAVVFLIWLLISGWSPESLSQWSGIIWALIAAMLLFTKLLPPSLRRGDTTSLVKGFLFSVALIYSVKSLFVLIRNYSSLSSTQRLSGYLGAAPLVLTIFGMLVTYWAVGGFHQTKK